MLRSSHPDVFCEKGLCVSRPPDPWLAPGPQSVFIGPGLQFGFTYGPRFVFTSTGQDSTTTTATTSTIHYQYY